MLQGEFSRAGKSIWRLAINSTLGLGGFFDPASKIGIGGLGWQWTR
jgi:ABC-type transporter lipoprotein component MlaA